MLVCRGGRVVVVGFVKTTVTITNTTVKTSLKGKGIVSAAVRTVTERPRLRDELRALVFVNINLVRTIPVVTMIVTFLLVFRW